MNLRNLLFLLTVLIGLSLALPSCNSDDPPAEVPTCTDGILNQGEDTTDCGGPCPPCEVMGMNASVGGYKWVGKNIVATYAGGKLIITADNAVTPLWQIHLVHSGPAQPGTYALDAQSILHQFTIAYAFQSGSITITKFDTQNKVVSGTFSMICKELYTVKVESGVFTVIPYN